MAEELQDERSPGSPGHARRRDTLSDVIEGKGARIMRLALVMTAIFIGSLLALGMLIGDQDPTRLPARLAMLALTLASLALVSRGLLAASVRLFLFAGTAIILVQAGLVSGVRTPILMTIPGLLVLSGWFIGQRYTFALAGVAIAGVSLMALLEQQGILVPAARSVFDLWSMLVFMLIAMAVIGVYAQGRFIAQLRRAEHGALALKRELEARHLSEARLRETLENTPNVAVQWFDRAGRIRYWNPASELLYGYGAGEAEGHTLAELGVRSQDAIAFEQILALVERDGVRHGPQARRLRHKDGTVRWVMGTVFRMPGFASEPLFVSMDVDITAHRNAEAELHARNESLRLINQLASRLYGTHDVAQVLSRTVETITEVARTPHVVAHLLEPDGEHLSLVASNGLDRDYDRLATRIPLAAAWLGQAFVERRPLISRDLRGEQRMIPIVAEALIRRGLSAAVTIPLFCRGEATGCISLFYPDRALDDYGELERDTFAAIGRTLSMVLENARHLQDLHEQARHDSLTGLPNRLMLHERFEPMADAHGPRQPLAVLLLDLNRFKDVNDTLGHHTGDRLLTEIAARLSGAAGERSALTCRLGGDEFAVVLPFEGDGTVAIEAANRIREVLERPFQVGGISLGIGASIGVAIYPDHGKDSHELLRAADVAMYRAKGQGLGICLYDRRSDMHSPQRLALAAELAQAIHDGGLVMHYQPKIDLDSGTVCGYEALVRWQHPRLGLLYPGAFIQLVEASELVHGFTRAVIKLVLQDKVRLNAMGYRQPVAINLSARNLIDDRCVEDIERLVRAHGLAFEEIEIELTETAIMHDPEHAGRLLDRLDAHGVRLSIDDFGTGYSSLALLKRLPLDALKIDQSFVRDLTADEQDAAIVRSTVALAHNLGLRVVAEGVEDEETLERLREMGCNVAQGYLLGRPLPLPELASWLGARQAPAAVAVEA